MKVNFDIKVDPVETPLSKNRLKVEYIYTFSKKVNLEREIGKVKRMRRPGWKRYDFDSVVHHGSEGHLWFYTVYYKRVKPIKCIRACANHEC